MTVRAPANWSGTRLKPPVYNYLMAFLRYYPLAFVPLKSMNLIMKKNTLVFILCGISCISIAQKKITLPNGWSLSPAGRSLPVGDLPLNIAVSRSKKYIAVTNNGQGKQSLQLIDVKEPATDRCKKRKGARQYSDRQKLVGT
jgi:hypothetical protein